MSAEENVRRAVSVILPKTLHSSSRVIGPVTVKAGDATHFAFATSLTDVGIRLIHMTPIPLGKVAVIVPTASGVVSLTADILTSASSADGWYSSGGRFLDVEEPSPADNAGGTELSQLRWFSAMSARGPEGLEMPRWLDPNLTRYFVEASIAPVRCSQ